MIDISPLTAIATVLGIIGTSLGIVNTYMQIYKDRVKLKVIPGIGVIGFGLNDNPKENLYIKVINFSRFPVTINHVGFVLKGKRRWMLQSKCDLTGTTFPHKLEPRESLTFCANPNIFNADHFANILSAYAITNCGVTRYGKSSSLTNFIQEKDQ